MTIKRLWIAFVVFVGAAFFLLGFFGQEVYRQAPPIPERVATADGRTVYSKDQILTGQQVWQSLGGQQIGSIWGHGAYQAPDWSADWLYRESRAMLASWSRSRHGQALETLYGAAHHAGFSREGLLGSATGVFVGQMTYDWMGLSSKVTNITPFLARA